jgi:hypothetical protein
VPFPVPPLDAPEEPEPELPDPLLSDEPPETAAPPELSLLPDPLESVVLGDDEVVLLDEVVVELAAAVFAEPPPEPGTVNVGAPDVSVDEPLLPQAARGRVSASMARQLTSERVRRTIPVSSSVDDFERIHPPPAVRAVVQIFLRELVAPVAKTEVLDRPGQLGRGRSQRQKLGDDFQLLAGFAVDVRGVGLGVDDDLAPAGGRAHAVALANSHRAMLSTMA